MPKSIKFNLLQQQYAIIYEEAISDWGLELQEITTEDQPYLTEDGKREAEAVQGL